jgi:hypothetical protein
MLAHPKALLHAAGAWAARQKKLTILPPLNGVVRSSCGHFDWPDVAFASSEAAIESFYRRIQPGA